MLALCLALLLAADPAPPAVRFPDPPAPVSPTPAPVDPAAPVRLTPDLLYVVQADADGVLDYLPDGLVTVTKEAITKESGPVRLRGRFADAPAKVQTRVFTSGFLYTVEAGDGSGRVTLSFVPAGTTDRSKIVRRVVDVNGGQPVPPPIPPGPQPPAPTTPVAFLVVVEETDAAVGGRGAFFADAKLAAAMKAKGVRWRVVNKDVQGQDGKPPADVARFLPLAAGKPYPSLFTVDAAGKLIAQQPMPKTPAELLALIGG